MATSPTEILTLPPALDIASVQGLKDQLLALRGRPVTLDASGVDRVGGLGLQVLLAARATWAADQQALTLADPSDGFLAGLSIMGVDDNWMRN
jgi:chemotaxis protein CheX